jgi:hypothetical protein
MRFAYGIVEVTFADDPDRPLIWISSETLFFSGDPAEHYAGVMQAFAEDTGRVIASLQIAVQPMAKSPTAKRKHPEGVTGENPAMVAEFIGWQKQRLADMLTAEQPQEGVA